MARILLEDEVLIPDVNHHAAAVETKVNRAGLVAQRTVDDVISCVVHSGVEFVADYGDEVGADVREGGACVNKAGHGEGVELGVGFALGPGLGDADGGYIDPVSGGMLDFEGRRGG